jgi:predicted RNA methylase
MRTYYSIFADGLEAAIEEALQQSLSSVTLLEVRPGLIIYSSSESTKRIEALRFVRNTFLLLRRLELSGTTSYDKALKALARDDRTAAALLGCPPLRASFRIIIAEGSRLVSASESALAAVEQLICKTTGLKVHRSRPDHEFWLHLRSGGLGLFSLRVTRHKSSEQTLAPGELRPEIVDILCRLSNPRRDELFLDPFAGSGAIPLARSTNFPRCTVLANDGDLRKVAQLKAKVSRLKLQHYIIVRCLDALQMRRYQDGCIDKIVTDPPWGIFRDLPLPPRTFFEKMLIEFCRVLKPGGKLVILLAREHPLELIYRNAGLPFRLQTKRDILLSGKKASIYELIKQDGKP